MSFDSFDDLHRTPQEAIRYSQFFRAKGEMAMHVVQEAKAFFNAADLVADLGCGTGASTIFAHKMTPNAGIVTVDVQNTPFPEVIELLEGKHIEHHRESIQDFLNETPLIFDALFIVKASHAIREGDAEKLAAHTKPGGYLLQIDGDVTFPAEMNNYWNPVWFDKDDFSGTYTVVNALWQKK
jgi:trans-aconitate methyltransferase